jgi:hypothetical protein
MTSCDEVRGRLPEHVLGTVEGADDVAMRRHLRGCAGCRAEMDALGDGLTLFSRAAHDHTPPPDLQEHVRTVLAEEWRDPGSVSDRPGPRSWRIFVPVAAAVLLLLMSVGWGMSKSRSAEVNARGADSYEALLSTLGGYAFRVGTLEPAGADPLEGSVVVYDSHVDQSWVVLFVRTWGVEGPVTATMHAADGRTVDMWPFRIDHEGEGAGWFVTSVDLEPFTTISVSTRSGDLLATAEINELASAEQMSENA